MSWVRREGEFHLIIQGPYSWWRFIQVKTEGSYSVPSVVQKIP